MDGVKQVIATFYGQVKSCRGHNQTQWKSGFVKVCGLEDGGLCAKMYLNVMPNQVYSHINVKCSGVSVKSNRVVIEDARGPGMYVRLANSREAEDSRKAICQINSYEAPKRSKAEVGGYHSGLKSTATPLKSSSSPSVMKQASPAVSWTKIATPVKSVTKSGDSYLNNSSSNVMKSVNRLKRPSLGMEDGDIDTLYNDENKDKTNEYTRFRKALPSSDTGDHHVNNNSNLANLKANNFYGKSALMSPGLHIKSPRRSLNSSSVRDQATPSANKGLYSSGMASLKESSMKTDDDVSNKSVVVATPSQNNKADTEEAKSCIVGFDNLGNTCFMNSPLQCLAYLEPLALDIQVVVQKYGKFLKSGSVIRLLYMLMKDVRRTSAFVNPERVKMILMRLRRLMDGKFAANTQQDAHELLAEILDRCDEEVKELLKLHGGVVEGSDELEAGEILQEGKGDKSPEKPIIPNPTIRNFNSFFKNSFQYQKCKNQTFSQEEHDTTMMLALTSHPELHLQDCIDNLFKGCEVEMKCDACKENEKATITRKMVKRPRYLILNLLRYSTDNMDAKKKLDRVTIPRYISISDFCSEDAKPPAYITPTFLIDRMSTGDKSDPHSGSPDTNGLTSSCSPTTNKNGSDAIKVSPQTAFPSPPSSDKSDASDTARVPTGDTTSFACSDTLDSLEKTVDDDNDDSVFGRSRNNHDASQVDSSTSALYPNASCEPLEDKHKKDIDINVDEVWEEVIVDNRDDGNQDNNGRVDEDNNNDDEDDDDDGVVSFGKIPTLKKQNSKERLKCYGGSEASDSYGEVSGGRVNVAEGMDGVKAEQRIESTHALGTHEDPNNDIDHGIEGDKDYEIDYSDFVPVGQVQTCVVQDFIEADFLEKPVSSLDGKVLNRQFSGAGKEEEEEEKVPKQNGQIGSAVQDYGTCLKIDVDDPSLERGNNYDNHNNNSNNNDIINSNGNGFKSNVDSMEEDSLLAMEDMGIQMICGRNVHEYSEAELMSLDVGALTEYEMLLFAQALSRFEYEKESKLREKEKELEQMMYEDISDEFYDENLMEETESFIKSTSNCLSSGDGNKAMPTRVQANGQSAEESSSASHSASLDDPSGSLDSSFCQEAASSDASLGIQKVPDVLESGEDARLLCFENLSEDDDVGYMKGLKISSGKFNEIGARIEKTKAVGNCLPLSPTDASGVLSDKNHCKTSVGSNKISSKPKARSYRDVTGFLNSFFEWGMNQPPFAIPTSQPLSPSQFQKPTSDLCIASPSKTRNLVKTRDYLRLRSPSASPKKKAVKSSSPASLSPCLSPAKKGSASKQLRFSEDAKSENFSSCRLISPLPSPSKESVNSTTPSKRTFGSALTPDHKQTDITNTNNIWGTSRSLVFGEDEPDSMNFHKNNDNNNDGDKSKNPFNLTPPDHRGFSYTSAASMFSSSTAGLSAITTSTPIPSEPATSATTNTSPNLPFSTSTTAAAANSNNGPAAPKIYKDRVGDGETAEDACASRRSLILPRESENNGSMEKDGVFGQEPTNGPFQDGSTRRKINRSLTNSFAVADGKENSNEITSERQARRKRIGQIEQGEADCSYRLVGIVNHHGESLFAGHYTSSCFNLQKQRWFTMDDKHTREAHEWEVRKGSSTTGYIFFYMDKDLFDSYAKERAGASSCSSKPKTSSSSLT